MTDLKGDHAELPGFEVLAELGRGGFGVVLLARHRALGRLVAIKQIPTAALSDVDAVARFRREAVVLAGLDHPRIVGVHDFRIGPHGAVLVMEYVPGRSLRAVLDQGPMPPPLAVRILTDVAVALDAARRHGIVHRDVKPANVFLAPDGSAKPGDFGIARAADPALFRTAAGVLIGTPAYLPPEAIQGERAPDHHGDDYSFAVMAYEMLVGVLPFRGEGLSLLGQHGFATPRSPSEIHPDFPAPAAGALLQGLVKDPDARLPAMALAAALREIPTTAWDEVTPLAPEFPEHGATSFAPATGSTTLPRLLTPRRRRRRRALVVVVAAAALAGVAVAVLSLTGGDPLVVSQVALTSDPAEGGCPTADFVVTARIATNGTAGHLRLQWSQPNGDRTEPSEVRVPEGQREVVAELRFSVQGNTELSGDAVLHVLGPDPVDSRPLTLTYRCPPR